MSLALKAAVRCRVKGKTAAASPRAWWTIWRTPQHQITRLLWVKSYRPIEPKAPPDVGCCSKIGRGFASLRNVPKGHKQTPCSSANSTVIRSPHRREQEASVELQGQVPLRP